MIVPLCLRRITLCGSSAELCFFFLCFFPSVFAFYTLPGFHHPSGWWKVKNLQCLFKAFYKIRQHLLNVLTLSHYLQDSHTSHVHFYTRQPMSSSQLMLGSVQFSHSVVSDSLRPDGLQHARPPYPSPTPGAYSNSYLLSQ